MYWDREVYNPHRVFSQFGLVQNVLLAVPVMSLNEIDQRFLTSNIQRQPFPLASLCPKGFASLVVTPDYVEYWRRLQLACHHFHVSPLACVVPGVVSNDNHTLRGRRTFFFFFLSLIFFSLILIMYTLFFF